MKKIIIVDYGMNNLFSIYNSILHLGFNVEVSSNHQKILNSDVLILPGVGSFPKAMNRIKKMKLDKVIKHAALSNKLIIGICLGMQLLFNNSREFGITKGLGIISGEVQKLNYKNKKIITPHVGWNKVKVSNKYKKEFLKFEEKNFYYVHSFFVSNINDKYICMQSNYSGVKIPSLVKSKNIVAFQFHPEKSGKTGLKLLQQVLY